MELVVLSGKGGTGKTTIATALSELAQDVTRIDCDVEVPNFYLFYNGKDIEKADFIGGMGETAQELFVQNGMEVVVGANGFCDDLVQQFIKGELKSTGSVCREHQHEGDCDH